MRWWGWGEDAHAGALPAARARLPRRARRHRRGAARARGARAGRASSHSALARGRARRAGGDRRRRVTSATTTASASCTPPERATRTWSGCARARPRARPTRSCYPGVPRADPCGARAVRRAARLAVVPFGGGTSVVGGVAPLRGSHRGRDRAGHRAGSAAIASLDAESATVTVGAGMRAPALERELASHGLTLGHFPQSYEYVSLGGCAATRSAGQASTGYGAIEKMVLGLRLAAPAGEIDAAAAARDRRRARAAPAAGRLGGHARRDQRGLAARAPGTRGARLRGRLLRGLRGRLARRFASSLREHALPDVARLSDEAETRMSLALAGEGGLKGELGRRYLDAARLRRRLPGDRRLRRRRVRGRGAAAPHAAPAAPRGRAAPSAPRRGGPGARGASPLRTCATICSASA